MYPEREVTPSYNAPVASDFRYARDFAREEETKRVSLILLHK